MSNDTNNAPEWVVQALDYRKHISEIKEDCIAHSTEMPEHFSGNPVVASMRLANHVHIVICRNHSSGRWPHTEAGENHAHIVWTVYPTPGKPGEWARINGRFDMTLRKAFREFSERCETWGHFA
jgi:hypothetical protein